MKFHQYGLTAVIAENRSAAIRGEPYSPCGPHPMALALHDITIALLADYPDRLSLDAPLHLRAGLRAGDTRLRPGDDGNPMCYWPQGLHFSDPAPGSTRSRVLHEEIFHILDALGFRCAPNPSKTPQHVCGRVHASISLHRRLAISAAIAPLRRAPAVAAASHPPSDQQIMSVCLST